MIDPSEIQIFGFTQGGVETFYRCTEADALAFCEEKSARSGKPWSYRALPMNAWGESMREITTGFPQMGIDLPPFLDGREEPPR